MRSRLSHVRKRHERVKFRDLVEAVARTSGVSDGDVRRTLDALSTVVVDLAAFDVSAPLPGLGYFRQGRVGPKRIGTRTYGPYRRLAFHCSRAVRDKITAADARRVSRE